MRISRFTDAQRVVYPRILQEIRQGRKRTHWMWFVFPQLRALGKSETAQYYGIADRAEALAYLDNPVLRLRLAECTMAVLSHDRLMFHHPDNHKLRSSMTLFSQVVADPTLPNAVLAKFFSGPDPLTLDVLDGKPIVLPQPTPATAMGRVTVGHHWEKQVAAARAAVNAVGERPERTAPMLRDEVESFIRGFNLSPRATRRIVDEWMADQEQARDQGYHDGVEETSYYDQV